ncbi:PilN domain-containing protein [Dethiosulfovibrio sp. F2B]|uniref:PilN domain-containing protein n=1 Tax=Dethiosulfovibrio faecalis TaxID=2720018 RepID=UPI001F2FF37B|nr:PilN domain-containing protein [Dethiosulfovibrio faecalis]MCF4150389.1 PilN domain-containing protein [Dethiosulfovibrio faecalis]
MTVRLNLLPPELRPVEKSNKVNLVKILAMSISAAAMVVCIGVLFSGILRSYSLQKKIDETESRKEALSIQSVNLISELERLREKESLVAATLKLLHGDLPLLEIFRQIELSLPDGVWLESLRAEPGKLQINGFSYNENDVVLFATGLMESPAISQVGFPNTRRVSNEGTSLVEFRLLCTVSDFKIGEEVSP